MASKSKMISRIFRGIAFTPSPINKASISWGLEMIFL